MTPTIHQILNYLNTLVKPFENRRVNSFEVFHKDIEDEVADYLVTIGLEYETWSIRPTKEKQPTLFKLDIPDFEEDAKPNIARKGRINTIYFYLPSEYANTDVNYTIEQYLLFIKLRDQEIFNDYIDIELNKNAAEIEKLKQQLHEGECKAMELKRELKKSGTVTIINHVGKKITF